MKEPVSMNSMVIFFKVTRQHCVESMYLFKEEGHILYDVIMCGD